MEKISTTQDEMMIDPLELIELIENARRPPCVAAV